MEDDSLAELSKDQLLARLKLRGGTFFCTTLDVWWVGHKKPLPEHWEAFIRREEGVEINVKKSDQELFDYYKNTRIVMERGKQPAPIKSTKSRSTGSVVTTGGKTLSKDVVGNSMMPAQEISHLLPAGTVVHEEWFGVAAAVVRLPKSASVLKQLMATRGVMKEDDNQDNDANKNKPTEATAATEDTEVVAGATTGKREREQEAEEAAAPKHAASPPVKKARKSAGNPPLALKDTDPGKEPSQKQNQEVTWDEKSVISQDTSVARKRRVDNTQASYTLCPTKFACNNRRMYQRVPHQQ